MRNRRFSLAARCALHVLVCAMCALWIAPASAGDDAAALRDRFAALTTGAASSAKSSTRLDAYGAPVYLQSLESGEHLDGDVWARIDHPFGELREALGRADRWCEILILHHNVKYCRSARELGGDVLHVGLGRKSYQALADAYWLRFTFRDAGSTPNLLRVELSAPSGPLSTYNYRLLLEAAPLTAGSSVLRLHYGYGFGAVGRLAMQSYLATVGRDKVGFSVTGRTADGQPTYVGGMRGVVERNAMRYFLAIRAHLAAGSSDGTRPLHAGLRIWFESTERYPRQLHELERAVYMDLKVREVWRQQTVVFPPSAG